MLLRISAGKGACLMQAMCVWWGDSAAFSSHGSVRVMRRVGYQGESWFGSALCAWIDKTELRLSAQHCTCGCVRTSNLTISICGAKRLALL